MKKIIEFRSVTSPDGRRHLLLLFNDGTSSGWLKDFSSNMEIKAFIDGMKEGFKWAEKGIFYGEPIR